MNIGFKRIIFLLLTGIIIGCQTTPKLQPCIVPTGFNVENAFSSANVDLSQAHCQYQFSEYLDALLDIAASDPRPENKQQFSNFFAQARDNGALSQLQAKDYYQRYFTEDFVSLGKLYNNCSTTCRNQSDLVKQMKQELRDKEQGLLKIADDRSTYAKADREFNQLLTLIDATCLACQTNKEKASN